MTLQIDDPQLKNIRRLAWWLDSSIPVPGTRYRVGLDAVIGLIPGIGDWIGSLLSSYILLIGAQMGVSPWTLVRMLLNILVESVVGLLPAIGDVFDAVWKANERNLRLLEKSLATAGQSRKVDRGFVILLFVSLFAGLGALAWLSVQILLWLVEQF